MTYKPNRPFLASQVSNAWRFTEFPPETEVSDLLRPETWSHCAKQYLRPLDEVVVIPQGAPFRAHLLVMDTGETFAKMRLLDVIALNVSAIPEPKPETADALSPDAPVEVVWKGPALKYSVIRRKDGEKLRTGFAIKAEAESWAADHLHAMA